MRFHRLAAIGAGVLCFLASAASAQVTGRIVGPGATRLWVAIAPLAEGAGAEGLGESFAQTLRRNLELSGYFRIVDPGSHIEGAEPTTPDDIRFANWRVLGAQALVKGEIRRDGDRMQFVARMFDVSQERRIGGHEYRANGADTPRVARRFADEILGYLTGERGGFDSRIVFVSRRAGRAKEVWAMAPDGGELVQLTRNATINLAPAWSPDAESILFTSYQDRNPSLYEIQYRTRRERRVSGLRGLNLGGEWAPDGSAIAVSIERDGNADLYLLSPEGRITNRLTRTSALEVSPTWSPDGSRLAYVSDAGGSPQIYVMNRDGSGSRRITFDGSYNTSPDWSPKGDRIAYVTRDQGFQIAIVGTDGRGVRRLTASGANESPSFSPDGRYVVYSARRGGRHSLMLSDVGGTHQVELTPPRGDDTSPAWSRRLP